MGRVVIDCFGVHAAHDCNSIGNARGNLWKDFADILSALAHAIEGMLRCKTLERLPLQLCDLLTAGKAFRHRLAVQLGKLLLIIKRVQMGHAAGHVEPDHALGFRRHVIGLDDAGPDRWGGICCPC